MGLNQSKTFQKSDFTFEQSYNITIQNENSVEVIMKNNAEAISTALMENITIDGNKGSNISLEALSQADIKSAQEISACLEAISKSDVAGLIALDVMNTLSNHAQQDTTASLGDKVESISEDNKHITLDNCVNVCNKLSMYVEVTANYVAKAESVMRNVKITNNEDTNVNLKATSNAKVVAQQLVDAIGKAAEEIKTETYTDLKTENDFASSSEQNKDALKKISDDLRALGEKIAEEAGLSTRSLFDTIGDSKWLILGPILAIIAIIALIIVFKLVKGSGNNDKELKKLELELESKRLQQMQQQQQMYSPMMMSQMYQPMQPQMMPQQSMQPQQMMSQQSMQPQQMQMMPQQMQMMPQQSMQPQM